VKEKKVRFKSSDRTLLHGILTEPSGKAKGKVLLAHGITVEKNEGGFYSNLAQLLCQNDLNVLRFDFRGHGESGGKPQEMTIRGEIDDLSAAVAFLRATSPQRIVIVGTSFGAGISVLYTSRNPQIVSSLILLCPVLDYERTFLRPETEWAQEWFSPKAQLQAKKTGILNLDGFPLGKALLSEFKRNNPGKVLLTLDVPTLIIHGTDDSMVPYRVAHYYGSRYPHGRFLPIRGADHGFEGFEKKVYSEVIQWILLQLES